jgi:hypothetical protein
LNDKKNEKEVRRYLQKGAQNAQIDFKEGRLAVKIDPWGNLLHPFIDLKNLTLRRFPPRNGDASAFIPARTLIEIRGVTETLNMRKWKVKDMEGRDYSLRVRPYRTADNKMDGGVIMLVDLEGTKDSDAGETPKRAKQIFSHK